jgi:hypothetical protein
MSISGAFLLAVKHVVLCVVAICSTNAVSRSKEPVGGSLVGVKGSAPRMTTISWIYACKPLVSFWPRNLPEVPCSDTQPWEHLQKSGSKVQTQCHDDYEIWAIAMDVHSENVFTVDDLKDVIAGTVLLWLVQWTKPKPQVLICRAGAQNDMADQDRPRSVGRSCHWDTDDREGRKWPQAWFQLDLDGCLKEDRKIAVLHVHTLLRCHSCVSTQLTPGSHSTPSSVHNEYWEFGTMIIHVLR